MASPATRKTATTTPRAKELLRLPGTPRWRAHVSTTSRMPVTFVSHGAPTLAPRWPWTRPHAFPDRARGGRSGVRRAIVLRVRALGCAPAPSSRVRRGPAHRPRPFVGFPAAALRPCAYEPPGAPALAARVVALPSTRAGIACAHGTPARGLDHGRLGAATPLAFPCPPRCRWSRSRCRAGADERARAALPALSGRPGRAFAPPWREEGVVDPFGLVGAPTHNPWAAWTGMRRPRARSRADNPAPFAGTWARGRRIEAGDTEAMAGTGRRPRPAPFANQPHGPEHFPARVRRAGAAGGGKGRRRGRTLHHRAFAYGGVRHGRLSAGA